MKIQNFIEFIKESNQSQLKEYEITLKSNPEIIDIKEIDKPEF